MNHRSITDCLIHDDPAALEKLAEAGFSFTRRRLREGDAHDLITRMLLDPETAPVRKIARAFACLVAEFVGLHTLRIDALNRTASPGVCASHDYCDANVFMQQALLDVTGIDAAAELPDMSELTAKLWDYSWRYTKLIGFHRLSAVRGCPDSPPEDFTADYQMSNRAMVVTLPTAPVSDESGPILIDLDYWGRNPHLQVLCRSYGADEEPAVCVRYDKDGKVVEVVISEDVLVVHNSGFETGRRPLRVHRGEGYTPWEIERDANPVCMDGDQLQMPSGLTATVMRLRDRYDNDIEAFRDYDETYGILARLDSYPASNPRHQCLFSVEQAWEVNPLTAGTTDPADFSIVSELRTPTSDAKETED
jgi:hypothetical protein